MSNGNGAAFAGKSRTNNSLESGFEEIARLAEFIGKMREFIQQWSTLDKTSFPFKPTYPKKILEEAANFFKHVRTPNMLYYPRKGEILEPRILIVFIKDGVISGQ